MNDRFLKACRLEPVDKTPVWFMRQAGRCLPEYRKIKEKHSFIEILKNPDLATEVTLLPIDILGVDAAIVFSDLFTTPIAMGVEVEFAPGPEIANPFRSESQLKDLRVPKPGEGAPWLVETIKKSRAELEGKVPLIGFVGAPITMAAYLVEGSGKASRSFDSLRVMFNRNAELAHNLLDKLADAAAVIARDQIDAGAHAIQIFDSWVGVLGATDYASFGIPYLIKMVEALKDTGVPLVYYAGGASLLLPLVRQVGADVISLDWRRPLDQARQTLGENIAVQGNLDPAVLFAHEETVRVAVKDVLQRAGSKGHIFNLGHGVLPDTDPEVLKKVVEYVHEGLGEWK